MVLPTPTDEKHCRTCKTSVPVTQFSKDRRQPDGLDPQCRECKKSRKTSYLERNREKIQASDKQRRLTRRANGLCTHCGRHNDRPQFHQCSSCSQKAILIRNPHRFAAGPCVVCGFEWSDIHHVDGNHQNNAPSNLIPLCPNHHRMLHRGLLRLDS